MTILFHRDGTTRLPYWDYSGDGAYFITICTADRENFFGTIRNGKMYNSLIGDFVRICWRDIPRHFPFVVLDTLGVMPDHIHAILFICKTISFPWRQLKNGNVLSPYCRFLAWSHYFTRLQIQNITRVPYYQKNHFGPQSHNLAAVIRGFKIGVTKLAKMSVWQPRYYDHIIRDASEWRRLRQYIFDNPVQWQRKNEKFQEGEKT